MTGGLCPAPELPAPELPAPELPAPELTVAGTGAPAPADPADAAHPPVTSTASVSAAIVAGDGVTLPRVTDA